MNVAKINCFLKQLSILCLVVLFVVRIHLNAWKVQSFHRRRPAYPQRADRHKLMELKMEVNNNPFVAVMIVPTGIGANIGGYAGDALPAARLLSAVVDDLITHPNVVNGAMLYWPKSNIHYVEGSSLDSFAEGYIDLEMLGSGSNKIGLLLDKAIEPELRLRHLQVADAARATLGIDVAHCIVTSREVGVRLFQSAQSGASWGSVQDTATLLEGARELVEGHGCSAVAVVARFPEDAGELCFLVSESCVL